MFVGFFLFCFCVGFWGGGCGFFFNDGGLRIAMSASDHFCLEEQPMVTAGSSSGKVYQVKMQLA